MNRFQFTFNWKDTPEGPVLTTERLVLRPWRDEDRPGFAALNADPHVVEFLPNPLSREQSDAVVLQVRQHFAQHGFGFWPDEAPGNVELNASMGLNHVPFEAHFTPKIEIGWRLAHAYWGQGYATEAARAALRYGFERLELNEIVAFTAPANQRSRNVMERLGMRRDPADDFEHPDLEPGHPLRPHVLYRLRSDEFAAASE